MVRQTVFFDDSIIAFFICTTSQSLSDTPFSRLIALMPRKHTSAFSSLILEIASRPTVIFEFLEILSPIAITSMFG
jgi:hypothetical protein